MDKSDANGMGDCGVDNIEDDGELRVEGKRVDIVISTYIG